jgi:hypothetical protein
VEKRIAVPSLLFWRGVFLDLGTEVQGTGRGVVCCPKAESAKRKVLIQTINHSFSRKEGEVKPKAILFLVLFCLALGFLAADGFCTTAKKVSADGKAIKHISEDVYPPEEVQSISSLSKYSTAGSKDSADCYLLIPDTEVPPATEHDIIGTTWYDFQKNGSMGRMISVGGAAGYRHISWMWTAGVYPGTQRRVYARSKPAAGVWSTVQEVGLGTVNSGYCNQTHLNDGTSVVLFHRTGLGGGYSYMGMADGPAADPLYTRKWDLPDDLPEAASVEAGAWPKGDVLYVVDETVHPTILNYLHIIETESALEAGARQFIGYMRCYVSPTAPLDTLYCQTPTISPEVYAIKSNQAFQDEVYGFDESCDLSAVMVTNRFNGATGQRVAMAYMPIINDDCDQMHNVGYYECMDNGDGWLDDTNWPPTLHMVADYTGANERAYHDVSACYDYDDSLHIVWTTAGFDPANPGFFQPGVARIYHWSKENGISVVASKIQENANPSAHCINASKVSISPKDPALHGDSTYLFCIWAQVDSSDQSAGEYGNADIFGSGSFDGGNTWGKVLNLTGTPDPGCAAGDCRSEHNPSLALNMLAGDLHVEYICDLDAGFGIYDEGVWTENPVMYMRVPEWAVTPGPRGEYKIEDPAHWYHPPIKVLPDQNRTIKLKVFSVGNEDLIYSVSSDHPCIQVSVPPTNLAPKDSVEIPVLLDGTAACNGTFIAGHVNLTTNDPALAFVQIVVHAVVADDYYECPRDPATVDTVDNGSLVVRLVASCQMEMDDTITRTDTTYNTFFRGGAIVATTQGVDTLVGRWMGDNDLRSGTQDTLCRSEISWDYDFWFRSTKEIFIEATHLSPPAHLKWWWWEIGKGVKVFKPDASDIAKRIVIQHVTVKRQDPPGWWPDLTPFTNYEDTYIGMAWDIDCPWDSADTDPPTPFVGDESATNLGEYDAANHIAYLIGFGNHENPGYDDYYAGIALTDGSGPGESIVPYGAQIIKNNRYLYPTDPWGWKDGELYELAATPGPNVHDPDSLVDRSIVLTAQQIQAGTDPDRTAYFTVAHAFSSTGLSDLVAYMDSARAMTTRMVQELIPQICGDVQNDGVVNVGDVVYLVTYLYKGGPEPVCPSDRGDVNNDGVINVGDVVYLVTYLYKGGPAPSCTNLLWYWR